MRNTGTVALAFYLLTVLACGGSEHDPAGDADVANDQLASSDRRLPTDPGMPTFTPADTSVVVTWPGSAKATGYEVDRAPDVNGAAGVYALVASVTTNTVDDVGLESGATYWYRVRATNKFGDSPWSAANDVTLLAAATGSTSVGTTAPAPAPAPTPTPTPTPTPAPSPTPTATATPAPSSPTPTPTPTPTPAPTTAPTTSYGAEFFVATTGNDSNPGTLSQPFKTLERARSAVQTLKTSTGLPANGVAVTIRGGTYYRTSTLVLASADSGAAGRPVVWRAYPGEQVRISGGKRVTGWTAVTSSDPNWSRIYSPATLYKASLGITSYGDGNTPREGGAIAELFYNGAPMQLGRWPNEISGDPVGSMRALTGSGTTVTSSTTIPAHNWAGAAAQSSFNRPWFDVNTNGYDDMIIRVDGVSGNTFTLGSSVRPLNGQALWYAMNLLEEVDQPGEYWIDRVAGTVYFRPPNDVNPDSSGAETIVSNNDSVLVQANSTSSYLRFEGLTFEAGQRNLLIVNGSNNAVSRCTFRDSANAGLILAGSGHTVDHVNVTGIGHIGIDFVGPGVTGPNSDTQNASSGVTLSNSDIHHVARYLHNGIPGVRIAGSGHSIRNNDIHDQPWAAIFYFAKNTVIELNRFWAAPTTGSDTGTIYTWQITDSATEIRYNYFHDVVRAPAPWSIGSGRVAIYLDQDSVATATTGFNVHGNVVYRYGDGTSGTGSRGIGITNKGSGNVFQNNLFAHVDLPYVTGAGGTGTVAYNQAWQTGSSLPSGNASGVNPNFIDEANGNLANQPDGTIRLSGGTEVIPFSSMGIK